MFLYKIQFLLIFSFLSIPIELWKSTAAIFRQSAGYVFDGGDNIVKKVFISKTRIDFSLTLPGNGNLSRRKMNQTLKELKVL